MQDKKALRIAELTELNNVNSEQIHMKLLDAINNKPDTRETLHRMLMTIVDRVEIFTLQKNTNPAGSGGLSTFNGMSLKN